MRPLLGRIILGAVLGGAIAAVLTVTVVSALSITDLSLSFLIGLTFGYIGSNVGIVVLAWRAA